MAGVKAKVLPPFSTAPGQLSPVELRGCKRLARRTPMGLVDRRMGRTSTGLGAYIQVNGQQREGTCIRWPQLPGGGGGGQHRPLAPPPPPKKGLD